MSFNPIVIVGAPRSGTNMLRDILTSFENVSSWPCDEINYIWRYGNASYPSDAIPPTYLKPSIKKYINSKFEYIHKKFNSKYVVEKTCANCLRLPFVDSVLDNAKYIYIYRDGIDVTGSANERWKANLDLRYILQKVKFVPFFDLPYYAIRYFFSRIYMFYSNQKRLAFWGPVLDNMQKILKDHSLNEICALQWKECVESAEEAFLSIPDDKVLRVSYESFVMNPLEELTRIVNFMNLEVSQVNLSNAVVNVSSESVGKGRKALDTSEVLKLEKLLGDCLEKYNYL